jgi:SAM-dependent methyltransferase
MPPGERDLRTSKKSPQEGQANAAQIKSRARVRDLAEVYTHEREVEAMLDLVADMFPGEDDPGRTDRTFLEPACGHGNFLAAILKRKLHYVTARRYGRGERFEYRILRCVASIYGIDINADNIAEAQARMLTVVADHLEVQGAANTSTGFHTALNTILATNVIRADTLADAARIELVTYEPTSNGSFIREWSCPLDPAGSEPNLFSPPPRRDEIPIHYSQLGRETNETVARPRKAA